jgi:hypothetical protein
MQQYICGLRNLVNYGLELIARARFSEADTNDTLDGLWEVLINIDYVLQQAEKMHKGVILEN